MSILFEKSSAFVLGDRDYVVCVILLSMNSITKTKAAIFFMQIMAPPSGEDILFLPCPSVRLSVCHTICFVRVCLNVQMRLYSGLQNK